MVVADVTSHPETNEAQYVISLTLQFQTRSILTLNAPQYFPSRIISPTRCTRSNSLKQVCSVSIASSILRATFFCSSSARFYTGQYCKPARRHTFSPKDRPTSPIWPSSSPIPLFRCTVPCRIDNNVDTDETNSYRIKPNQPMSDRSIKEKHQPHNCSRISSQSPVPSLQQIYPDSEGRSALNHCLVST